MIPTQKELLDIFQMAIEQSSDGVLLIHSSGSIHHVNDRVCELTGYSKAELLDMTISDLDPLYPQERVEELFREAYGQRKVSFESLFCSRDGVEHPIEATNNYLSYQGEKYACTFIRDIKKRKVAERNLQESEQKLRAILNHHYQMTGLMDTDGRLLMANETALKMIGNKEEDVVGRYMWETPWWEHSVELQEKIRNEIAKTARGEFVRFETEHEDAHGRIRTVDFSLTPLSLRDDEKIDFIIPEGRDITELKQHEKALRDSEALFRSIFESTAAPMGIIARDGSFIQVNQAACQFFGYTETELSRLTIDDLTHPADISTTLERYQDLREGKLRYIDYEKRYRRRDGSMIWGHTRVAAVRDADGDLLYFVAQTLDITERQRTEQIKNEMLSAVSHEMGTPLSAIIGFVEFLLHNEVDRDQQLEYLQIILKEGERLHKLINNLLNYQILRAGFGQDNFQEVSLCALLEDVVRPMELISAQHSIAIDCSADLPTVLADYEMLYHALENLLSNAIKYSPAGGQIIVAAGQQNGNTILSVKDEGKGIALEAQSKIFDRFFRIDFKDKKNVGGSGLGLPLVKEIAKLHNGSAWVESKIARGSTFYFSFPTE